MNSRDIVLEIFNHMLESVMPETLIKESVRLDGHYFFVRDEGYDLRDFKDIYVFGSGKASVGMGSAVEDILGDRVRDGFIISPTRSRLRQIRVFPSSHPVPSEKSLEAAEIMSERLSRLSGKDFFIYLLSGGSSALMEKPLPPVTLKDFQATTNLLIQNSVPIKDINVVRKHISVVKGGRLGRLSKARGVVIVLSDVVGDDLETIGSAPMYRDSSTYEGAYHVLHRHDLWDEVPPNVKKIIEGGITGEIEDTPREENRNIKHVIIGSNLTCLGEGREFAEKQGFKAEISSPPLTGEAADVGREMISRGRRILDKDGISNQPLCLLFGGESMVTLRGSGLGGRNQEMCLSALKEMRDTKNIVFLSAGTDGVDGNSAAAGAIIDYRSYWKARELGLNIDDYLANNDSYNFFRQTGDLIVTGPTGTNVMDVAILFIKPPHLDGRD